MGEEERNLEVGKMAIEKHELLIEEKCLVNRLRKMAKASKAVVEAVEAVDAVDSVVRQNLSLRDLDLRVEGDRVSIQLWGRYETLFSPQEFTTTFKRLRDVRQRLAELTETLGF